MDYKGLSEEKVERVAEDLETLIEQYMDENYDPYALRGMVDTEFRRSVLMRVMEVVETHMGLSSDDW